MTEFEKLDVTSDEFRRTYTNATSLKKKQADWLEILARDGGELRQDWNF
jgi:hypothetical protein